MPDLEDVDEDLPLNLPLISVNAQSSLMREKQVCTRSDQYLGILLGQIKSG